MAAHHSDKPAKRTPPQNARAQQAGPSLTRQRAAACARSFTAPRSDRGVARHAPHQRAPLDMRGVRVRSTHRPPALAPPFTRPQRAMRHMPTPSHPLSSLLLANLLLHAAARGQPTPPPRSSALYANAACSRCLNCMACVWRVASATAKGSCHGRCGGGGRVRGKAVCDARPCARQGRVRRKSGRRSGAARARGHVAMHPYTRPRVSQGPNTRTVPPFAANQQLPSNPRTLVTLTMVQGPCAWLLWRASALTHSRQASEFRAPPHLDAGHAHRVDDVGHRAAARQVVHGLEQALAVGGSAKQAGTATPGMVAACCMWSRQAGGHLHDGSHCDGARALLHRLVRVVACQGGVTAGQPAEAGPAQQRPHQATPRGTAPCHPSHAPACQRHPASHHINPHHTISYHVTQTARHAGSPVLRSGNTKTEARPATSEPPLTCAHARRDASHIITHATHHHT
jgi:hypothetical protein